MTDNETAATFIRWKPCSMIEVHRNGWHCQTHMEMGCYFSAVGVQVDCGRLGAPDMHRPDNYMRALEAVAERDLFVTISIYKASGGPQYTRVTIQRGQLPDEAEEPPLGQGQSPEAGRSAITALAALYNKEHQS